MTKIISLEKLSKIVNELKKKKKKVSLCHGTFDLLHVGHIDHFEASKKISDFLIVSVTADKFVLKGPNRPRFKLSERVRFLSKINSIDYVIESHNETAIEIIKTLKPSFYCKGPDYSKNYNDITNNIQKEVKAIKSVGGKIIYTKTVKYSSSNILNSIKENNIFSNHNFIKNFKNKINFNQDFIKFGKINNLKVLVVGETIIDKYIFCEAMGKSGKESVLVMRDMFFEKYLGGAAAVANNISNFSKKVSYVSFLGSDKSNLDYIRSKMSSSIKKLFLKKRTLLP